MAATRSGRFLFVTFDGGGNVPPFLGLGQLLVARGHSVELVGAETQRERIEAAGYRFHPFAVAWDDSQEITVQLDRWQQLMCGPAVAETVLEALDRARPDVLVVDCMLRNALCAAERALLPTAVLFHARYRFWSDSDDAEVREWELQPINETRRRIGLEPMSLGGERRPMVRLWQRFASRLAVMPREFDLPEDALTSSVSYVGPLFEHARTDAAWDSPWSSDTQLVVVSFSTTYMHQEGVIRNVLMALDGLGVKAVVTLGAGLDPEHVPAPPWAAVRRYVPHAAVLPHASLVVTHAGMGTVMSAFAHGVPMLCLPLGRDQPLNAQRVVELGAGRTLAPDAPVDEIQAALVDALGSTEMREGARRMAAIVASYGEGARAVGELEQLLG